jgi:hypothetical protein
MTYEKAWMFCLDNGEKLTIYSQLTAEEMSKMLMEQPADGYVYDEETVVPVRRVVFAKRVGAVSRAPKNAMTGRQGITLGGGF